MYNYLPDLHRLLVFSKEDVVRITGSKERASDLLLNYQSRGFITKLRRGLYCVLNLGTSVPVASKFQIATSITPTATVAYHAAMEYHGFAHQPFYDLSVVSATRFTSFEFDGISYSYYRNSIPLGILTFDYDHSIRVTDIERTVIDCIDRIDLCGGVEELLHCLSSIHYVSTERLLQYLTYYNKIALYKKAGYILSFFADTLHLPDEFFSVCRNHSDHSVTRLTTMEQCPTFISEWRLYVPAQINNYI